MFISALFSFISTILIHLFLRSFCWHMEEYSLLFLLSFFLVAELMHISTGARTPYRIIAKKESVDSLSSYEFGYVKWIHPMKYMKKLEDECFCTSSSKNAIKNGEQFILDSVDAEFFKVYQTLLQIWITLKRFALSLTRQVSKKKSFSGTWLHWHFYLLLIGVSYRLLSYHLLYSPFLISI